MSGDFLIWHLHLRAGGEVAETSEGGIKKNIIYRYGRSV
jgi:hypothetical protein